MVFVMEMHCAFFEVRYECLYVIQMSVESFIVKQQHRAVLPLWFVRINAKLPARIQYISGRRGERPLRLRFAVLFLCPRENAKLVTNFLFALHTFRFDFLQPFQILIQKIIPRVATQCWQTNFTKCRPPKINVKIRNPDRMQQDPSQQLITVPFRQPAFTRRTSGQCLEYFVAENLYFSFVKYSDFHYILSTFSSDSFFIQPHKLKYLVTQ